MKRRNCSTKRCGERQPRRKTAAEEENERLEYEGICAKIDRALTGRKHQPEAAVVEAQKKKARKSWKKEPI